MTTRSVRCMIVLGSGGHTAEMLKLVAQLDRGFYRPRCYVSAATDALGTQKALAAEQQAPSSSRGSGGVGGGGEEGEVVVARVPRSREVGQSYVSSVWTTLVALAAALALVWRLRPQLLLVNGPGTCIPLCCAALLFRLVGRPCKIVYVESIARVQSLSLSGLLLYHLRLASAFFVQWPRLQRRYPRTLYAGRLY